MPNRSKRMRSMVLALTGILSLALVCGCPINKVKKDAPMTLDEMVEAGARIMWVGAHPDDESLVGAVFAKAGPTLGNPLFFFVLNHGDGGECCLPEGCDPDLATVRGEEMKEIAELYHAELQHEYYFNAPLPVESFPTRHELAVMWKIDGDPAMKIAKAIRTFKPDALLTFDPDNGFTGHPEHQLTSRLATLGVRMAADVDLEIDALPPFRVENTYYALNKYWIFRLLGTADKCPVSETFDAKQECVGGEKCRNVMAEFTRAHRTQDRDMGTVRKVKWMIDKIYLYRVDPWTEIKDPYEPVGEGD
ncbi:PIG-L family deacetylase [Thermodesulfobacteriota bacterium]